MPKIVMFVFFSQVFSFQFLLIEIFMQIFGASAKDVFFREIIKYDNIPCVYLYVFI